jgi:hypothetical protein
MCGWRQTGVLGFVEGWDEFAPWGAEVAPGWVGGDDEFQFADTEPALELLLAVDGCGDRGEAFKVDELSDVVASGVAVRVLLVFVLCNT